eukprot:2050906-Pleurochrysis_carterae.AAC.1
MPVRAAARLSCSPLAPAASFFTLIAAIVAFNAARGRACCSKEAGLLCTLAAANTCAQRVTNSLSRPSRLLRRSTRSEASVLRAIRKAAHEEQRVSLLCRMCTYSRRIDVATANVAIIIAVCRRIRACNTVVSSLLRHAASTGASVPHGADSATREKSRVFPSACACFSSHNTTDVMARHPALSSRPSVHNKPTMQQPPPLRMAVIGKRALIMGSAIFLIALASVTVHPSALLPE